MPRQNSSVVGAFSSFSRIRTTEYMDQRPATCNTPIRCGLREYCESSDGIVWTRMRRGSVWEEWHKREPTYESFAEPPNSPNTASLWLVLQLQTDGEPLHWSLVVTPGEDRGVGNIYQVEGDTLKMHYCHVSNKNIFASRSLANAFRLASLPPNGEELVKEAVLNQQPPAAETIATINENCQGWTIRVLRQLEDQEIIPRGVTATQRLIMDSL
ncbi:hypothetical protein GGR50DRAFT_51055 [Xylaria sp. CBS 124048]|nr:hypothetical protein GGR50DRAFT_51055 [Xylaria sp. CBS 124048]